MLTLRIPLTAILLLLCSQNSLAIQSLQTIASIQQAVGNFIDTEFKTTQKYEYVLSPLDQRLQLPLCASPLQVYTQTGTIKAGINTIGVHCDGDRKWNIYTTAQIKAFKKVLVLSRFLRRGDIITRDHLTFKNLDIAKLHQGYLIVPETVVNNQAKRNLAAGTVINRAHFAAPTIIRRGEKVDILAKSLSFSISMDGIALADGHKDQKIKVKNIHSKRIIQATVVKPGQVSVY